MKEVVRQMRFDEARVAFALANLGDHHLSQHIAGVEPPLPTEPFPRAQQRRNLPADRPRALQLHPALAQIGLMAPHHDMRFGVHRMGLVQVEPQRNHCVAVLFPLVVLVGHSPLVGVSQVDVQTYSHEKYTYRNVLQIMHISTNSFVVKTVELIRLQRLPCDRLPEF